MKFINTKLKGVMICTFEPNIDTRGSFARIFNKKEFKNNGIPFDIIHINMSVNTKKGTIRGMHYQKEPYGEDKIVQCIQGSIYDVVIDLRKRSPTYGKWIAEELHEDSNKMLFIPKGCAQGFQTLTKNTKIYYLMSNQYNAPSAQGVRFNDPFFNIPWPLKVTSIAKRDTTWPFIKHT